MQLDTRLIDLLTSAAGEPTPEARLDSLLTVIREASGLELAYLTHIEWDDDVQHITHVDRAPTAADGFDVPPGTTVDWGDTLCRRTIESGIVWNDDVQGTWGDSGAAQILGSQTYVSVPVRIDEASPSYGTLCATSRERHPPDPAVVGVMRLAARLMADAIIAERQVADAEARARRAEQLLRDRATFTAQVEHAMRTPLTVVHGWSEMLVERGAAMDDAARDRAATAIHENSQRLLSQVQDLLDESRATMGATSLEHVAVDLGAVARGLTEVVAPRTLEVVGDATVVTDPIAVRILVEHLVENAATHTPEDTTVTVRLSREADTVTLVVEDDGPGLPVVDADLFAPFQRGTAEGRGSGLGLHIVRTIATSLGGDVVADERPGGGARFTVHVPDRDDD